MMKRNLVSLISLLLFVLLLAFESQAQHKSGLNSIEQKNTWEKISSYFYPPKEYNGQFGDYRSPLKFYNGEKVKSAKVWPLRREEIRNRWMNLMGRWPELLKDQQMTFLDSVKKDGYTQYSIRFNWLPNEKTDGYLLVPVKKGKKPAVITVFYEPETAIGTGRPTPHLDFARQLVRRGYVALSIGTSAATEAKTYSLFYPSIDSATVQPLSMLAYAAANSWHVLANLPEVDNTRIGIMGLSFGGKWAMFASCLFEKFACAVWSDPGIVFDQKLSNYWEPYYLGYHPKPWRKRGLITEENPAKGLYVKLSAEGYDLHELHALMAPRPFLVSGGTADSPERWVPLNHTIAVNNLLGVKNKVAMTNRKTHLPDSISNVQAYLFLDYFLKGNVKK